MEPVRATLLGIAQDGGVPQAGCTKTCCMDAVGGRRRTRYPVSLGVTTEVGSKHLMDVSRSLPDHLINWGKEENDIGRIDSIWLSHAHVGHYDGLFQFGREVMGTSSIPCHLSKSMHEFCMSTPSLASLFDEGHLIAEVFDGDAAIEISEHVAISPIKVPHRDEFSDTHGFVIKGPKRRLLYLTDHDSWDETLGFHEADDIRSWLRSMHIDIALVDGTFWSEEELGGKATEIGHPTVQDTLERLGERRHDDPRIVFIHLNHTNPLLEDAGSEQAKVRSMGWEVGRRTMSFEL